MSIREIEERIVVGKQTLCDVCLGIIEEGVKAEDIFCFRGHICASCIENIPCEIVDVLKNCDERKIINKDWRTVSAREFILNMRGSPDSFDHKNGKISNFKDGNWAVFGNNEESKAKEIIRVENMEDFESVVYEFEFYRYEIPFYLLGTLIDGKLRNFQIERKLIEKSE